MADYKRKTACEKSIPTLTDVNYDRTNQSRSDIEHQSAHLRRRYVCVGDLVETVSYGKMAERGRNKKKTKWRIHFLHIFVYGGFIYIKQSYPEI